jgi:hypothetical protein
VYGFDEIVGLVAALEHFDNEGLGSFAVPGDDEDKMDGWFEWQEEEGRSFFHLI